MEEFATPSLKQRLTSRRVVGAFALALAVAAAGAGLGYQLYLKPFRAAADARYQSHLGLMRLYDLQLTYHAANGAYANDLDTLLAAAPDAAKIREQLKLSVDINTLAVIGDENRFRLEANILDQQRTLVKIKGPLGER